MNNNKCYKIYKIFHQYQKKRNLYLITIIIRFNKAHNFSTKPSLIVKSIKNNNKNKNNNLKIKMAFMLFNKKMKIINLLLHQILQIVLPILLVMKKKTR